jgi:hypothetical protein
MLIQKRSQLTGVAHELDIPVTQEQIALWRASDKPIQVVLSHLSQEHREFLLTGITDKEWDTHLVLTGITDKEWDTPLGEEG